MSHPYETPFKIPEFEHWEIKWVGEEGDIAQIYDYVHDKPIATFHMQSFDSQATIRFIMNCMRYAKDNR